jgi:hypothetical protein
MGAPVTFREFPNPRAKLIEPPAPPEKSIALPWTMLSALASGASTAKAIKAIAPIPRNLLTIATLLPGTSHLAGR